MRTTLALSLCFSSFLVLAQPDAGALLNQQDRQQPQRIPERLPEFERQPIRPALKEIPGLKVKIKSIRFTGAAGLSSDAELQAQVAEVIGQELDFAGLERLAQRVTEFLRGKGWLLAQAYLPRQDVTDGNIEITLRAGRLDGKAGQTGKSSHYVITPGGKQAVRINPQRLNVIADPLLPAGAVVSERDMERALLLMSDLPGISARARLEPGAEEGSTRVAIDVEEGALVTGSAGLDNYGNRDTGAAQLNAAVQLNDPSGNGEQISASATHSEGLDLIRLAYSTPVGGSGLKLGGSWSPMRYKIIRGTGLDGGLKGSSDAAGLTLSYPFVRGRYGNLYGALGYTHKAVKDESLAGLTGDKRSDVLSFNASGDMIDSLGGGGINSANIGLAAGRLALTDDVRVANNRLTGDGYGANGGFGKVSYSAARLQKLPGNFTLFANFIGQSARKNLDSSEKFILGGPYGVRAYPGSEASGDSGWLANLELRYDLPTITPLGRFQIIGFYDTGRITLHQDTKAIFISTATGQNSYGLSGWGAGVNLSKAGSHAVRLVWAKKIGDNPGRSVVGLDADSNNNRSRLWLQAAVWF